MQAQAYQQDLTSVAATRAVYVAGEDRQGRTCVVLCPDLVLQSPAAEALVGRGVSDRKRRDSQGGNPYQHQISKSTPTSTGSAAAAAPTAAAASRRPGASRASGAEGLESAAGGMPGEISSGSGEAVLVQDRDRPSTASGRVLQTRDRRDQQDSTRTAAAAGPPPTTPGRAKNGGRRRSSSSSPPTTSAEDAEASSSSASSAQHQQHRLLLYFLRLMDSVARKEYVVLLCGGGGSNRDREEDQRGAGRGRWLSWARFSFLGQIHSLLPRR